MAEGIARIAGALLAAYLIGAIPFALIVSKWFFATDLREHGSGNLGATNVLRVLGVKAALAVFVLDIAKGSAAIVVAMLLYPQHLSVTSHDWVLITTMIAAVVGHSYSPYVRFTGGKGVATAAGALLILTPAAWVILFATFVAIVLSTRIVSLASIVIAVEFPLLMIVLYPDRQPFVILSFVAAAFVIWRHRSNIGRIVRREEARITIGGRGATTGDEGGQRG